MEVIDNQNPKNVETLSNIFHEQLWQVSRNVWYSNQRYSIELRYRTSSEISPSERSSMGLTVSRKMAKKFSP